jgi:hypothetical protein
MRLLLLLVAVAGLIGIALGASARRAASSPFGRDIWTVRLDASSSDHWIVLDAGRIRLDGHPTSAFLLAHQDEDAPALRFDEMKVVGGTGGRTLWAYDGSGSDYVDASGARQEGTSDDAASLCSAPRFLDVDGDGSDDVVFVEHDFVFGRQLRAVRIEP